MSSLVENGPFWLAIAGAISALIVGVGRMCSRSLCTKINLCCGLIQIERDSKRELELAEFAINHPPAPTPGSAPAAQGPNAAASFSSV
jgi:hypothetical protein